uniref:Uncharacterized protein n=1 Tax=Physcomitrium patens TaxID=3218 RepID=A0A2K1JEH8_PHYPA|nr:hypothetical protein PHYPA_020221 [Physcomitrium patens]
MLYLERERYKDVWNDEMHRGSQILGEKQQNPDHHDGREDAADLPHQLHGNAVQNLTNLVEASISCGARDV